ncbi:hypothetical protein [Hazenella coriacea]|uniref:Uncharacterized protein n=1 Tax=Hazenella coriacea TaxID=1179467 RepID=A0A4R3LEB6_9BACL|nr:hypothetical protein [Hazenella coriacea]TCS96684.1 hypothetical protein EDD58_101320 [Hazenella coriacea]
MKYRVPLILSIFSSVLVLLFLVFQWSIVDIITPFLMIPLWMVLSGFFILVTVIALIVLFKSKNWKPIAVQAITISLWLFFPFNQIILDLDFKMNKSEREKVIKMVENQTIKPNVSYNPSLIRLPKEYQHLSKGGGEIVLEKNGNDYYIFFYTFRGLIDNFSGFVYSPNDKEPNPDDFGVDFIEVDKLDKNWYFISAT